MIYNNGDMMEIGKVIILLKEKQYRIIKIFITVI